MRCGESRRRKSSVYESVGIEQRLELNHADQHQNRSPKARAEYHPRQGAPGSAAATTRCVGELCARIGQLTGSGPLSRYYEQGGAVHMGILGRLHKTCRY
jgi:hypothetical protein